MCMCVFVVCVSACAMKALNQKGIVHRDLKPGNILLSHSGKPNPTPTEITLKIGNVMSPHDVTALAYSKSINIHTEHMESIFYAMSHLLCSKLSCPQIVSTIYT